MQLHTVTLTLTNGTTDVKHFTTVTEADKHYKACLNFPLMFPEQITGVQRGVIVPATTAAFYKALGIDATTRDVRLV